MTDYYNPEDLAKFGDIGKEAPELWRKFLEYYGAATEAGTLTKREKTLIGLAVAHTVHCPYCIDAFTQDCLSNGADMEQMTESVHVASAVKAGATLIHGVQMRNCASGITMEVNE